MGANSSMRFGLMAALVGGLAGCGQQAADSTQVEDKEKQLVELQEEVAKLEKEIAEAKEPAPSAAPAEAPAPAPPPRSSAPPPAASYVPPAAAPPPVKAAPASITIPAGTRLAVRTTTEISTQRVRTGDIFSANLEEALVVGGRVVAPKGARVTGRVVNADQGGKVKGRAQLEVGLSSLMAGGSTVDVDTNTIAMTAEGSKKDDAVKVGIATGIGAAIGAIAGGGKGAAIGAGAGAGAGTGAVLLTRGDAAVLPAESVLDFSLTSAVRIPN